MISQQQESLNIDWNNLDIKKYTKLELNYLKNLSYYRYAPPNEHMLYLMLSVFLIAFSSMFYAMHLRLWVFDMGEFPLYHRTQFFTVDIISFISGILILPYWYKLEKKSRANWREMSKMRKMIDTELNN